MAKVYFRHAKTGKRFEVVRFDNKTNVMTLRGEHAEFEQPYDKEQFKRLGYTLEKAEESG